MPLKAILFDLDGTLLDYDMRRDFIPHYFAALAAHMADVIPPDTLAASMMRGSEAITVNDGSRTNDDAFADVFYPLIGYPREELEPRFMDFYERVFPSLQKYAQRKPEARQAVQTRLRSGLRRRHRHQSALSRHRHAAPAGVGRYRRLRLPQSDHLRELATSPNPTSATIRKFWTNLDARPKRPSSSATKRWIWSPGTSAARPSSSPAPLRTWVKLIQPQPIKAR